MVFLLFDDKVNSREGIVFDTDKDVFVTFKMERGKKTAAKQFLTV